MEKGPGTRIHTRRRGARARPGSLAASPGLKRPMTVRRRMAFSAIVTLTALLALAGAREKAARDAEREAGLNVVPDPLELRYEMIPRGNLNSWGYREREIPPEKPAGTLRVAVLGDSVTLGSSVPMDRIYSRVAEARLHEGGRRDVQVLNFSAIGYDTQAIAALMAHRAARWAPDLVVYGYYVNDTVPTRLLSVGGNPVWVGHEFRPFTVLAPGIDAALHQRSALFRQYEGAIGARWVEANERTQEPSWDIFRDQLRELRAAVADAGATLVTLAIPPHVLVWRDPEACRAAAGGAPGFCKKQGGDLLSAQALMREEGVEVLDGLEAYRTGPEQDLHVLPDDHHHPNAEGHRRLGEALASWILAHPERLAPRAEARP